MTVQWSLVKMEGHVGILMATTPATARLHTLESSASCVCSSATFLISAESFLLYFRNFFTVWLFYSLFLIYFFIPGCISLLGMEGGAISESQIYSSSVHYGVLGLQRWGPELARLNNQGIVNAWTSAAHDRNPWIEVRQGEHFSKRTIFNRDTDLLFLFIFCKRLTCRRRCVWRASLLREPVAWVQLSTSRTSRWRAVWMESATSLTKRKVNGGIRLDAAPSQTDPQFLSLAFRVSFCFKVWYFFALVFLFLRNRFLLETLTTTAQRPTFLIRLSWPSTYASSLWCAAGPARCAWSWWVARSTVSSSRTSEPMSVLQIINSMA